MKTRNRILALGVAACLMGGSLTSCDYLDIVPEQSVPEDSVDYTDIENMYAPVSGAYASIRTNNMHWVINLQTIIRDGDVWSGRIDDQGDLLNINKFMYGTFWGIREMWNQYYGMIKITNGAIESLEAYAANITNESDMKLNRQYQGEVRIIRALAYYRLAQMFGAVTILRTNEQADMRRSTRDAVLRYVLEDLQYAIDNCPKVRPNEMAHMGAFTAYTAEALAAKANLILGNYPEVEKLTNDIISSQKFELYPDFYQLFKIPGKLCNESLMECQSTYFGMGSGDAVTVDAFFACAGPGLTNAELNRSFGGWNFAGYTDSFQNWVASRNETIRKETSFLLAGSTTREGDVVSMPGNTENTGCWNGKWYVPINQVIEGREQYGGDNNVRLIRYAEVLLMNAEALVRQGKSGDAPFNQVRKRAAMPELTGVTVDQILDERRMELCCEWGVRYEDLLRTGKADILEGWSADKAYFPVPADHQNDYPEIKEEPID
ncbi:MAG: RagB/SusD family nutrient uptake outer membrane protein [Muribaculaceae bacterium]|nr:RagB/SusD family nutrient uptake outer membrane protein [Muribaculaceae bacterium]